jgi:hypothetical protein
VKTLYVMGTMGSGKTAVCLALAMSLREKGRKVAYFKPVGVAPGPDRAEDEDAVLMKDVLGMSQPVEKIVLFNSSPHYLTRYRRTREHLDTVVAAFKDIASGADAVIVEGITSPSVMVSLGLDAPTIAKAIGAKVLMVDRIENDYSLDTAISYNQYVSDRGLKVIGTIFNNVSRPWLDKVKGIYVPIMEELGFDILGVIPKRIEIAAPTVAEFVEALGGEVLTAGDRLDLLVEEVLVGAMTTESAFTYLRRSVNKAVITGGDRADLALAALETGTSCLVLTGGLYPDVRVIARAEEKRIPIILVHYDTYRTVERLQQVSRKIKPTDRKAIRIAGESFLNSCNAEEIIRRLDAE